MNVSLNIGASSFLGVLSLMVYKGIAFLCKKVAACFSKSTSSSSSEQGRPIEEARVALLNGQQAEQRVVEPPVLPREVLNILLGRTAPVTNPVEVEVDAADQEAFQILSSNENNSA